MGLVYCRAKNARITWAKLPNASVANKCDSNTFYVIVTIRASLRDCAFTFDLADTNQTKLEEREKIAFLKFSEDANIQKRFWIRL